MKSRRLNEIVALVNRQKFCSTAELLTKTAVSPATLNRDLTELSRRKRVRKIRGGIEAIPFSDKPDPTEPMGYRIRLGRQVEAKIKVAELAFTKIHDGDIVFLDSSTTVYQLARKLQRSQFGSLTLITNSMLIMQEFHYFPSHYYLIGLGGTYDLQLNALLGQMTQQDFSRITVDRAFFSAVGTARSLAYSRHEQHAVFLKQVILQSHESYLLITPDKIDKTGLFPIAPLDHLTEVLSV